MWWLNLIPSITGIVDKLIPDADAANKLKSELINGIMENSKGQLEVNRAEAESGNVFVSGWRPMLGWVMAIAWAGNYVLIPIINYFLARHSIPLFPMFQTETLEYLLYGMLGLGGLRTVEKMKIK